MFISLCYDVVEDRRRNRLARLLVGYLDRVQKSVFEGEITESRYLEMREKALGMIDLETDRLRVYRLCRRCRGAIETSPLGPDPSKGPEDVVG